jgi:hypothetical protein
MEKNIMKKQHGPPESQPMIHGLADAALQIEREFKQQELSNYFEVLRFFQNPPYDDNLIERDGDK